MTATVGSTTDSMTDSTTDCPATRWTVQERTWKDELPELPDEVIALLATPVVVSASSWARPTTSAPAPARTPARRLVRTPKFLAPAAPTRNARRRTAGRVMPRAAARIA